MKPRRWFFIVSVVVAGLLLWAHDHLSSGLSIDGSRSGSTSPGTSPETSTKQSARGVSGTKLPARHLNPPDADLNDPRAGGRVVIQAHWGAGQQQLGRRLARESNPEGPMSFSVGEGALTLLDQVNGRLQRYDLQGRLLASFPITSTTAQDIAFDRSGGALVLDRLAPRPEIQRYDKDGKSRGSLPLIGAHLQNAGGVSGLFADDEGIYVELAHDRVLRLADGDGHPVVRDVVPGRPSRDGRLYLKAGILDASAGRLYVQAHHRDRSLAWEVALNFGAPLAQILLLDSDQAGGVYLGAEVGDGATTAQRTLVARIDGALGRLSGQLELPATTADASESYRPLVVGPNGAIYHLLHGAEGPRVTVYRFP